MVRPPHSLARLPMLFLLLVAAAITTARPIAVEARSPSRSQAIPPPSPQAPPLITTLVVLATGIDARQSRTQHADPYRETYRTFEATLHQPELDCPAPTSGAATLPDSPAGPIAVTPPFDHTHGPLVLCGTPGVAWLPYSYAGVFDGPGAVASYFGDTTGQALATSVAQLEAVVRLALRFTPPDVRIIVIGHSLGGAIGSLWGADHPTATIVTLDAPVNGIWVADASHETTRDALSLYCERSVGGLLQSSQRPGCRLLPELPALYSAVADDLRQPQTRLRLGGANTINFANPADVAVPAWYALNPASGRRHLYPVDRCLPLQRGASVDQWQLIEDFETHHACILEAAAPEVGAIVAGRGSTNGDHPASNIRLLVRTDDDTTAGDTITVRHGDAVVASGHRDAGTEELSLDVPWTDLIVEATLDGAPQQIGVLPVQPGADVTVSFAEAR
ncbi:MAG: hypothetical protein AB7R89_07895 [Dehalococcoidia bacterium]